MLDDLTAAGMRPPAKRACWMAAVLLACGCGFGPPDNAYQPPPPPKVTVARPVQHSVTLFIEENGETEAKEQAEVKARVRGFLDQIDFEPGEAIRQGEVLYVIERSEYEAALEAAQAAVETAGAAVQVAESQVKVAQSEVTRAEADFNRVSTLLEREAATQSQFDDANAANEAAKANKASANASVAAANAEFAKAGANLTQAQLDLDYTTVTAPIDGRITKTEIKLGNLVEDGSTMATIVDRSVVYANFNVSDRDVLRLQEEMRRREETSDPIGQPVYLRRELDEGFPFEGKVEYIDQAGVDQATGTLAIRAEFENPDDLIVPGLFVRVRVPIGELEGALLIPERAVSRDQTGGFVLTTTSENKVQKRPVETGQTFEGMVVIVSGLTAVDLVIIDGSQRARPGTEVTPEEVELDPPRIMGATQPEAETDETEATAEPLAEQADADPQE